MRAETINQINLVGKHLLKDITRKSDGTFKDD